MARGKAVTPKEPSPIAAWFQAQGWQPWPFQHEAWAAYASGSSGLIHVPTGAGKTYAAFGGPLDALVRGEMQPGRGLRIVYVTPLRALARDIELALKAPLADLAPGLRVESRTGDTAAKLRAKQSKQLPEVLVTTPESLALLIARSDARTALAGVGAVLVDEWHDLLTSKRGVQLQLTLSRLRALAPGLRTWGMSATLREPLAAAKTLLPPHASPVLVQAAMARQVILTTLLPPLVDGFPWAGHLGLTMLPQLLAAIDPTVTNLIFTNTRSQAERWLQAIQLSMPEWDDILALHHGSLDREARSEVEEGLKSGRLKIVVATSSLDLGVDFPTVEHVYQIGSAKGVARLMQRAGRAAHRPLAACRACCIPTNSMELVEFAAARRALAAGRMESRPARRGGLDVLAQHLTSCALGGGFTAAEAATEVRATAAYADLSDAALAWVLRFLTTGGAVLDAYPEYQRLVETAGCYELPSRRQASLHRMNIGTIVADEQAELKLMRGQRLGRVEESYVTKLRPGDRFVFAGRTLEFVKMHELTAYCKPSAGKATNVPAFQGTLLPLSLALGDEMRAAISAVAKGETPPEAEMSAALPMLNAQLFASLLPAEGDLLLETWRAPDGYYLFIYPFAGRAVHEGLAALLALRLSRQVKTTFAVVANDYGLGLVSATPVDYRSLLTKDMFTSEALTTDLQATVDAAQMAKRRFREIARIAGIVRQSYPGQRKGGRAVHASAALLFDTLARFDPEHLLIEQARNEAAEDMSDHGLLGTSLTALTARHWLWAELKKPSPFAFALVVERVRARLGSDGLAERVAALVAQWQKPDTRNSDASARQAADLEAELAVPLTLEERPSKPRPSRRRGRGSQESRWQTST